MPDKALRIVIPGGSGQVGTVLARHFHASGHEVTVLSRSPSRTPQTTPWRTEAWDSCTIGPWLRCLESSDVCINLAGRSVNCRYTPANRTAIYDSRITATRLLHQAFSLLANPPRVWLNSSTATIYRHALDRPMDEATGELGGGELGAPDTWSFSIKVAKDWEAAFFAGATPRTRRVALRSAITFNPDPGSVFAVLSRLVRAGLGGTNGPGDQFVSWIHEADFVRAVERVIEDDSFTGVVNLASPHPLPNREFMQTLRAAWDQPIGIPAPAWLIEIGSFLLRTESELVLKSRCVIPGRLLAAGFQFQFPDWPGAARDLVERWRQPGRRLPSPPKALAERRQ
jgi:uncharacterized protein (TIGR01777 family)